MRSSLIRSRLREGKAVRIIAMCYPTAMLPAHAAKAGYDAVWLETEHNTWDRREVQRMITMHHLAGIDCIVRTGNRNPTDLYHLLEDGATGLMIPLVNTPAEARALVQAVRFPPFGQRGLVGSGFDNQHSINGTHGYTDAANAETFLILQIETPEAVANVDAIARTKGVDGLFIGPADLSLRLGCPPEWTRPGMKKAQEAVAAAAAKHGIAWGRPTDTAGDIANLHRMGGRLVAHGSDFDAICAMMPTFSKNLAEGIGQG